MKSTNQARPKSTPKAVTLEGGAKISLTGSSRCTPTKKTMPVVANQVPFKPATGS